MIEVIIEIKYYINNLVKWIFKSCAFLNYTQSKVLGNIGNIGKGEFMHFFINIYSRTSLIQTPLGTNSWFG